MNWKLSFAPKRVLNVLTAMASLGLLIALAFSLNALFASRSPQITSQPLSPTATIDTSQTDPTADWKVYSNAEYGYELRYPADLMAGSPPVTCCWGAR